jgi:hypothetical protein
MPVRMTWSLVALQATKGLSPEAMGTDMKSARSEVRKTAGPVDLNDVSRVLG